MEPESCLAWPGCPSPALPRPVQPSSAVWLLESPAGLCPGGHARAEWPRPTLTIFMTDWETSVSDSSDAGRTLKLVPRPPPLVSVMTRVAVSPTT